jgi:hypothetical protein
MKSFVTTFDTEASPTDVIERARTFLASRGFTPQGAELTTFQRGSIWGGLTSGAPRNWKSRATLLVKPKEDRVTRVTISYDVNTFGQIVMQNEIAQLESELQLLQTAIQTGKHDQGDLKSSDARLATNGHILWLLALAAVVMLLVGILGFGLLFAILS